MRNALPVLAALSLLAALAGCENPAPGAGPDQGRKPPTVGDTGAASSAAKPAATSKKSDAERAAIAEDVARVEAKGLAGEDVPAPPDVAAPPADAEKTASGL